MASSDNARGSQQAPENVNRFRKRQQPSVCNGIGNSYEDRDNDFLCPICFDTLEEAHMTKCGHTFCFKCITASLEQSNRCPKCNFVIDKKDQVFPNFLLNELLTKYKQSVKEKKIKLENAKVNGSSELQHIFLNDSFHLDLAHINFMLDVLSQKKQQMEADCKAVQIQLLKEFLQQARKHKEEQLEQVTKEINLVDEDSQVVETNLEEIGQHQQSNSSGIWATPSELSPATTITTTSDSNFSSPLRNQDGFNGSRYSGRQQWINSTMASRRKRMHSHFDDLQQCYFSSRAKDFGLSSSVGEKCGLDLFRDTLTKFTRFSSVRPLATLNYASDLFNGSSIVSSIEFDKDNEFFAIAGVTKKIKLFEYGTVIQDMIDMHYPVNEMVCNSKISCISWSFYHKGMLASSDYEGSVSVWDAFTGQRVRIFQEHEKRCWSVDFNRVDTKLIASGSDDTRVKLWSTSMEHSITSLEAKANVCCVKFNPESRYHLAFGSADHCVHYYDLRNAKQALGVFRGHSKAVSYVKFLDSQDVVSASTDSQLKLWNISKPHCLRSFKGHLNEKNFVGLATDGDYIACGSETNALYIYYKGLSKQVLTFRFDTVRSVLEKDKKEEETNEFVSAVCWRTGSNVVVAANSQGTIKVLELV